jgi:hypothetical protein
LNGIEPRTDLERFQFDWFGETKKCIMAIGTKTSDVSHDEAQVNDGK